MRGRTLAYAPADRRMHVQTFEKSAPTSSRLHAAHQRSVSDQFDIATTTERHQGLYLAELEDEEGRKYLRISTPIGPYRRGRQALPAFQLGAAHRVILRSAISTARRICICAKTGRTGFSAKTNSIA